MTRRRWNQLSPRSRRLIVSGAVVEGTLKIVALLDLAHRSPAEVRGSKARWATALVLVNSFGAAPLLYLTKGRRRQESKAAFQGLS